MRKSQRMFQSIIEIVKYQVFSKLAVLNSLYTCKPLIDLGLIKALSVIAKIKQIIHNSEVTESLQEHQ